MISNLGRGRGMGGEDEHTWWLDSYASVQLCKDGEGLAVSLAPHKFQLHLGCQSHKLLHGNTTHHHTLQ